MMDHGYHQQTHATGDPTKLRESVIRVAGMVLLALMFALMAPAGLALATFSSLTSLGAIVIAVMGALRAEQLTPNQFTRWDEAAALMLLSLFAGSLVDQAAVEAAIANAG